MWSWQALPKIIHIESRLRWRPKATKVNESPNATATNGNGSGNANGNGINPPDSSQVLQPGSDIKPKLQLEQVEPLVRRLYGITVSELKELKAYDDRNYLILEDWWVIKVINNEKLYFRTAENTETLLFLLKCFVGSILYSNLFTCRSEKSILSFY